MAAQKPEDVDRLFGNALNEGDLDALSALYEPGATLMPAPGKFVTGAAPIRDALAAFLAMRPYMSLSPRVVATRDDLAVLTSKWEMTMTDADGKRSTMTGQSIEVVRRQQDGTWRFAIDLPFGVDATG